MTVPMSMSKLNKELVLLAAAGSCVAVGYGIASVHAEGAPANPALCYAGALADPNPNGVQTSVHGALKAPSASNAQRPTPENAAAQSSDGAPRRLCTGTTSPSAWTLGSEPCSFEAEVDISGCRFDHTQQLLTSLSGTREHWKMVGGASPYRIDAHKFGVHISAPACPEPVALSWVRERELRVDWIAVGDAD